MFIPENHNIKPFESKGERKSECVHFADVADCGVIEAGRHDWIKEHIEKYGREPNLFDGA